MPPTDSTDRIGRIVGICLSVAFFGFAVWYILSGRLKSASKNELAFVYALFILFTGPIAYFFANAALDQVRLNTVLGSIVISGGFAVAIAALVIANNLAVTNETWKKFRLKDTEAFDVVQKLYETPDGSAYLVQRTQDGEPYEIISHFADGAPNSASVHFKVNDGGGLENRKLTILPSDISDTVLELVKPE